MSRQDTKEQQRANVDKAVDAILAMFIEMKLSSGEGTAAAVEIIALGLSDPKPGHEDVVDLAVISRLHTRILEVRAQRKGKKHASRS